MRTHVFAILVAVVAVSPVLSDDKLKAGPDDETKKKIKAGIDDLKSPKAAIRETAAKNLGEFGGKANEARRPLCAAMNDSSGKVRVAAADALKKVDRELADHAIRLVVEQVVPTKSALDSLDDHGTALVPLFLALAKAKDPKAPDSRSSQCIALLSQIAPQEPEFNDLVLSTLAAAGYSETTVAALRVIPHPQKAVPILLNMIPTNAVSGSAIEFHEERRSLDVIRTLVAIADKIDDKTKAQIYKTLKANRFDKRQSVREAVEAATDKFSPH
jgi:hypothetical protein